MSIRPGDPTARLSPPGQFPTPHRRQAGAAAVAVLGLVPIAVLVLVVAFEATAVVVSRATAVAAADLAALAAVTAIAGDGSGPGPVEGAAARSAAATIAAANGATLVACACDVLPATVTVEVVASSPFGLRPPTSRQATSRATLVAEREPPGTARRLPSQSTIGTSP